MAILVCPQCGSKNRVDDRAADLQPVCGRCKQKLSVPASDSDGHPIAITDANFEQRLQAAGSVPLLVDAWATWCPPCRALSPTIDQLAAESGGRYLIGKLNVDENPGIATRFRIEAIPTLLIFKNGQLVDTLQGLQPKPAIQSRLMAQV